MALSIITNFKNENFKKHNISSSLIELLKENILNDDILEIAINIALQIKNFSEIYYAKNYVNLKNLLQHLKSKDVKTNELKIYTKKINNEHIKIFIYKYTINGVTKIIKLYNYNESNDKTIDAFIVNEISMQQYSFQKSEKCGFNVPIIYEYKKLPINVIENNKNNSFKHNTIFYIIMEYIDLPTLNNFFINNRRKDVCNKIVAKLNKIILCMEIMHIYHNDLNLENILIDYTDLNNFNIYIIDYGESTNTNSTLKSQIKNNSICLIDESKLENIKRLPPKMSLVNENNINNENIPELKLPPIKIPSVPQTERRKTFGRRNTERPKTPTLENIMQKLKFEK
jgi:tRNA A-37 threonylcarbamoyl transferase component Bud32